MGDESTETATVTTATVDNEIKFTKPEPKVDATVHGQPAQQPPVETKTPDGEATKKTDPDEKTRSVAQLAKLSADNRNKQAIIDKLQGEINAKKADGEKTAELQSELDAIKKNPRLLLKYGKSFEEILKNLSEDDEDDDPRYKELKERLDRQDEEKKKQDEEKKTREEREKEENEQKAADAGNANISRFLKEEGVKPGADGSPRWAACGANSTVANDARVAVLKQLEEWKIKPADAAEEDIKSMLSEYFDQYEVSERKRLEPVIAALGYVKGNGEKKGNNEDEVFSFSRQQESSPQRQQQSTPAVGAANAEPPKSKAMEFTKG